MGTSLYRPRPDNRELASVNRHRTKRSLWLLLRRYSPDYRTAMHGMRTR